jgi:hypothetical protein
LVTLEPGVAKPLFGLAPAVGLEGFYDLRQQGDGASLLGLGGLEDGPAFIVFGEATAYPCDGLRSVEDEIRPAEGEHLARTHPGENGDGVEGFEAVSRATSRKSKTCRRVSVSLSLLC